MRIEIVTSGQKGLAAGKIVGGGPMVATRQARALARRGIQVQLIDLNVGHGSPTSLTKEKWTTSDGLSVTTWTLPFDIANPFDPETVGALTSAFLDEPSADFTLIQDALFGAVGRAACASGRYRVWQPNDYSFLCSRSWFLKANGQRCDMQPEVRKCVECQLNGRTLIETAALRASMLFSAVGIDPLRSGIQRQVAAARKRVADIPHFLSSFDAFLAQSWPMEKSLLGQGLNPSRVTLIDYGIEPPVSPVTSRPSGPDDQVHFAFIARPSFEKGLHVLLSAWADLPEEITAKARLTVFSPIASASRFHRQRLEGLLSRCKSVTVSDESVSSKLDAVYSGIDVAVQPAIWYDNHAQTVLEALIRGVPAIVSSHSSFNSGLVQNGVNGFLVDVDSSKPLRDTIVTLVRDKGLLNRVKNRQDLVKTNDAWAQEVCAWLMRLKAMNQ